MGKKPNFDFERREREKAKAGKAEMKARAKQEAKMAPIETSDGAEASRSRKPLRVEEAAAEQMDAEDRARKAAEALHDT